MEKPQPSDEPEISNKAVEATVESDWLINLEVSLVRDETKRKVESKQCTQNNSCLATSRHPGCRCEEDHIGRDKDTQKRAEAVAS